MSEIYWLLEGWFSKTKAVILVLRDVSFVQSKTKGEGGGGGREAQTSEYQSNMYWEN